MKNLTEYYREWRADSLKFQSNYLDKRIQITADIFQLAFSHGDNYKLTLEYFSENEQRAVVDCILSQAEFLKVYAAPFASELTLEGTLETVSECDAAIEGGDIMEGLLFAVRVVRLEPAENPPPADDVFLRPGKDTKTLRAYAESSPYTICRDCGHRSPAETCASFWNVRDQEKIADHLNLFFPPETFEAQFSTESDAKADELDIALACRKCSSVWNGFCYVESGEMQGGGLFSTLRVMKIEEDEQEAQPEPG